MFYPLINVFCQEALCATTLYHIEASCKSPRFPSARNHYKHHHHTSIIIIIIIIILVGTRALKTILFLCEYKAQLCFVISSSDPLHELFSRGNCHCRGENWREHGDGTGTRFWIVGCDGNWQDCRDPGIMTSCCREERKK